MKHLLFVQIHQRLGDFFPYLSSFVEILMTWITITFSVGHAHISEPLVQIRHSPVQSVPGGSFVRPGFASRVAEGRGLTPSRQSAVNHPQTGPNCHSNPATPDPIGLDVEAIRGLAGRSFGDVPGERRGRKKREVGENGESAVREIRDDGRRCGQRRKEAKEMLLYSPFSF